MAHRSGSRLPPGQTETRTWPVLHYGSVPRVALSNWSFRLFGLVEAEKSLTWDEFAALPRSSVTCDIHCVTHWSRLDMNFAGIAARAVLRQVRPLPGADYVMVHAEQGFAANLRCADLEREDALFADSADGRELTPEHGWPLRLVVPHLYFWKSAKWVRGLEFMAADRPGFWEQNGYHLRGDPWAEQRCRDV